MACAPTLTRTLTHEAVKLTGEAVKSRLCRISTKMHLHHACREYDRSYRIHCKSAQGCAHPHQRQPAAPSTRRVSNQHILEAVENVNISRVANERTDLSAPAHVYISKGISIATETLAVFAILHLERRLLRDYTHYISPVEITHKRADLLDPACRPLSSQIEELLICGNPFAAFERVDWALFLQALEAERRDKASFYTGATNTLPAQPLHQACDAAAEILPRGWTRADIIHEVSRYVRHLRGGSDEHLSAQDYPMTADAMEDRMMFSKVFGLDRVDRKTPLKQREAAKVKEVMWKALQSAERAGR